MLLVMNLAKFRCVDLLGGGNKELKQEIESTQSERGVAMVRQSAVRGALRVPLQVEAGSS